MFNVFICVVARGKCYMIKTELYIFYFAPDLFNRLQKMPIIYVNNRENLTLFSTFFIFALPNAVSS